MTIFELNGKRVEVVGEHAHLLGALRDELNILSAKTAVRHQDNVDAAQ